jgi:hypothetical protein
MVRAQTGPPEEVVRRKGDGCNTVAAAASLELSAEVAALVGERYVPSLLMAEVARAGDLSDVKVVQRPPTVEAVVAERRSGVCAGYWIGIVIPAVTLIAAAIYIDA